MILTWIGIGVIWSFFWEWILRNYSDEGGGLPTHRARLFHIVLWPLAIFLVIYYWKN